MSKFKTKRKIEDFFRENAYLVKVKPLKWNWTYKKWERVSSTATESTIKTCQIKRVKIKSKFLCGNKWNIVQVDKHFSLHSEVLYIFFTSFKKFIWYWICKWIFKTKSVDEPWRAASISFSSGKANHFQHRNIVKIRHLSLLNKVPCILYRFFLPIIMVWVILT